MPGEAPETLSVGLQHIGQLEEPRGRLNVVDQVHSTGWGRSRDHFRNAPDTYPLVSVLM